MWIIHIDRINAFKYLIVHTFPDARSIHSAHYQFGPKACGIKRGEIDKILQMHVIEPAQVEWAAPKVFDLR